MADNLTLKVTGDFTISPPASAPPSTTDSSGCTFGISIRGNNAAPGTEISQAHAKVDSSMAFAALPFPSNLEARVFYLRLKTNDPIDIRLTHATTGQVTYPKVRGMMLLEVDVAEFISAVDVQGVGEFEWAATGPLA